MATAAAAYAETDERPRLALMAAFAAVARHGVTGLARRSPDRRPARVTLDRVGRGRSGCAYKERRHQAELQSWATEAESRFSDLFRGEEQTATISTWARCILFTVVLVLAYGLAVGDTFDKTTGTFASLPAIDLPES